MPAVRILPSLGDPLLAELLAVAESQDWPAIRELLSKHDVQSQDLTCLIWYLCKEANASLQKWLPEILIPDKDDPLALVTLASLKIAQGWEVRSAKLAQYVGRDQFEVFHSLLDEAQDLLYEAVEIDRTSAAPWYFLTDLCLGLNPGVDVAKRRFEELNKRNPGNVNANRSMLQILCRKWYGSHEQMHAFAREVLHGPHGLLLGELAAHAQIERWLDIKSKEERTAYMHQADVRAEILEAANRTIFRPEYSHPRNPYWAANIFALAFSLAGMWPEALEAFKATDGVVTARWIYVNGKDPAFAYNAWREFVLTKV